MASMNITLPAMGEGVIEATINKWLVKKGDSVKEDDPLVEVSTDKVDSEVPSPAEGVIVSLLAGEGNLVSVGDTIAVIESKEKITEVRKEKVEKEVERIRETINVTRKEKQETGGLSQFLKSRTPSGKFISPLVRSISVREGISYDELDKINGTGMDGRITKDDILKLLSKKKEESEAAEKKNIPAETIAEDGGEKRESSPAAENNIIDAAQRTSTGDTIIEMDRVRRLIADHMVMSKKVSPHVTSFIDADVTKLVNWRNSVRDTFLADEGQKLTLTPIFIEAAARALNDFPMINISVDGTKIIIKKNINIGMATALPDGNLIVPVIKNANEKNLKGIARSVNDLAFRARNNKLKPDDISGGTFTLTNFGSYNNLTGTPIINQPQAAILGTGAVRKQAAVIETSDGDMIAVRHIMILSLSYDHRVIDGALAGKFLNRIKVILENYPSGAN